MKTREHFFFQIPFDDLRNADSLKSIVKNLRLPRNKFPPEFIVQENGFLCAGYFVCYDKNLIPEDLFALAKAHKWKDIVRLVGDFLILCCDLTSKRLFVLTDQTGKFPCYFSVTPNALFLSTSLYDIVKSLPSLTLDTSGAFDYLYRNVRVTDRTIILEIKLIPPATLFTFGSDGSYSLESLIDVEEFINTPFIRYNSIEDFSETFLKTLEKLVLERLQVVGHFRFGAELSSGFDSTLICYLLEQNANKPFTCYSHVAEAAIQDTDPGIVLEFAEKHDLKVKFIQYDHIFPFSTKEDLEWIRKGPSQIIDSVVYDLFLQIEENGNLACFNGEGGDEIYLSDSETLELEFRFPIQKEYFEALDLRKYGIDKVLSKKGLEILFDEKRFQKKHAYSLVVPASAATAHRDTFPLSWETQVWPITPYMDPRLVQVVRGVPERNGKPISKQEIWHHRKDIFVPSQFRPKRGPDEQFRRYLTEKSDFVVSVLKNSLLGEKGWVKSSEIVENLKKDKVKEYYRGDIANYIRNLLRLEYFLQQNNVKVPV